MFKNKKKLKIALIILIITASVLMFLELTGRTSLILDRSSKKTSDNTAKTTSDAPSAQSDFSSSANREPTTTKPVTNTTVNDTSGSAQTQSNSSPLVSKDGVITVNSPTSNALFSSGSSLVGKATVAKVSYRLMDDVSGVTATGDLTVVGGNFSGKFSFSTQATQGRLDVFQTGTGGVEKSIIEIPVRFR